TQTSAQIAVALEHMKVLNRQVRSSTGEQSSASDLIRHATREAMDTITQIRVALNAHTNGHDTLSTALDTMGESLSSSTVSITALEGARAALEKQLRILEKEV
ncbi:MAG: hypothetical protein HXX11_09215, partial [Desulfuromonadales bacterium]|nr:hypothetical protein [Desulfuromonadales bacterium]